MNICITSPDEIVNEYITMVIDIIIHKNTLYSEI